MSPESLRSASMGPESPRPESPCAESLHPEALEGLSGSQAHERRSRWGPNRLPDPERHDLLHTLGEVLREPMFVLLLAAAGLYLLVGDLAEGALLLAFALLTVGLVVLQGWRRERALQALRELAEPEVRVLRDGRWQRRPAADLVPGDLVALDEGQRVPADAQVLQATDLKVDESLLTGESWPVDKRAGSADDVDTLVWAGTLVVSGHALAEVGATGGRTRMGGIGAALSGIEVQPTPLQQRVARLVRHFGLLALAVCAAVVGITVARGGAWWDAAVSALALGMGMMPEEFPMALAVFMSMGAWRLSRLQVLARRPAALEALGAVSVLCVDKTGTLTENRLRLALLVTDTLCLRVDGASGLLAGNPLLQAALRACRQVGVDPVDRALQEAAAGQTAPGAAASATPGPAWQRGRESMPTPERPAMVVDWTDERGQRLSFCKGAPETLVAWCDGGEAPSSARLAAAAQLAEAGWRVLAVAERRGASTDMADGSAALSEVPQAGWTWLGLLAFEDPLRPSVAQAVAQARSAGVAVVMVTGDHPRTARAIARQAGLDDSAGVMLGTEFAALSPEEQVQAAERFRVFARVQPQDKLALVRALQSRGQVVAMTGDGVNDAPALKAAHIGLAMGRRGTDVAREASAMVLLDEDFDRLVQAIALGRRLLDNLRKVSAYIVAVHIPLAGLALLPLLLGWPPLMLPAHVVLTEMVIDPLCSLAFENAPAASGLMQRPPRRLHEPLLLPARQLMRAALMGAAVLAVALAVAALSLRHDLPVAQVRTLVMTALTAGNLALAIAMVRLELGATPWRDPAARVLLLVAALTVGVWGLALTWPALRGLLRLAPSEPWVLLGVIVGAVAAVTLVSRLPHPRDDPRAARHRNG